MAYIKMKENNKNVASSNQDKVNFVNNAESINPSNNNKAYWEAVMEEFMDSFIKKNYEFSEFGDLFTKKFMSWTQTSINLSNEDVVLYNDKFIISADIMNETFSIYERTVFNIDDIKTPHDLQEYVYTDNTCMKKSVLRQLHDKGFDISLDNEYGNILFEKDGDIFILGDESCDVMDKELFLDNNQEDNIEVYDFENDDYLQE